MLRTLRRSVSHGDEGTRVERNCTDDTTVTVTAAPRSKRDGMSARTSIDGEGKSQSMQIAQARLITDGMSKIQDIIGLCSGLPGDNQLSEILFQAALLLRNGIHCLNAQQTTNGPPPPPPKPSPTNEKRHSLRLARRGTFDIGNARALSNDMREALLFRHHKLRALLKVGFDSMGMGSEVGSQGMGFGTQFKAKMVRQLGKDVSSHHGKWESKVIVIKDNCLKILTPVTSLSSKSKSTISKRRGSLSVGVLDHQGKNLGSIYETSGFHHAEAKDTITVDLLFDKLEIRRVTDHKHADILLLRTGEDTLRLRLENWYVRDKVVEDVRFYSYRGYINHCLEKLPFKERALIYQSVPRTRAEKGGYLFQRRLIPTSLRQYYRSYSFQVVVKKKMTRQQQRLILVLTADSNKRKLTFSKYSTEAQQFVVGKEVSIQNLRGYIFHKRSREVDLWFKMGENMVHRRVGIRGQKAYNEFTHVFTMFQAPEWSRDFYLPNAKLLKTIIRTHDTKVVSSGGRKYPTLKGLASVLRISSSSFQSHPDDLNVMQDGDELEAMIAAISRIAMFNSPIQDLNRYKSNSTAKLFLIRLLHYIFEAVLLTKDEKSCETSTTQSRRESKLFSRRKKSSPKSYAATSLEAVTTKYKPLPMGSMSGCHCDEGSCRLHLVAALKKVNALSVFRELCLCEDIDTRCFALKAAWGLFQVDTSVCKGKLKKMRSHQADELGCVCLGFDDVVRAMAKAKKIDQGAISVLFEILLDNINLEVSFDESEEFRAEFENVQVIPTLLYALSHTSKNISCEGLQHLVVLLNVPINRAKMWSHGHGIWQEWILPLFNLTSPAHQDPVLLHPSPSQPNSRPVSRQGSPGPNSRPGTSRLTTSRPGSSRGRGHKKNKSEDFSFAKMLPKYTLDPTVTRLGVGLCSLMHKQDMTNKLHRCSDVKETIHKIAQHIQWSFSGVRRNVQRSHTKPSVPMTASAIFLTVREILYSTIFSIQHDIKGLEHVPGKSAIWFKIMGAVDIVNHFFAATYYAYRLCGRQHLDVINNWSVKMDIKFYTAMTKLIQTKVNIHKQDKDTKRLKFAMAFTAVLENISKVTSKEQKEFASVLDEVETVVQTLLDSQTLGDYSLRFISTWMKEAKADESENRKHSPIPSPLRINVPTTSASANVSPETLLSSQDASKPNDGSTSPSRTRSKTVNNSLPPATGGVLRSTRKSSVVVTKGVRGARIAASASPPKGAQAFRGRSRARTQAKAGGPLALKAKSGSGKDGGRGGVISSGVVEMIITHLVHTTKQFHKLGSTHLPERERKLALGLERSPSPSPLGSEREVSRPHSAHGVECMPPTPVAGGRLALRRRSSRRRIDKPFGDRPFTPPPGILGGADSSQPSPMISPMVKTPASNNGNTTWMVDAPGLGDSKSSIASALGSPNSGVAGSLSARSPQRGSVVSLASTSNFTSGPSSPSRSTKMDVPTSTGLPRIHSSPPIIEGNREHSLSPPLSPKSRLLLRGKSTGSLGKKRGHRRNRSYNNTLSGEYAVVITKDAQDPTLSKVTVVRPTKQE